MEPVRDLIHKLSMQEGAGEGPEALLATLLELQAVLTAQRRPAPQAVSSRVAVVMPAFAPAQMPAAAPVPESARPEVPIAAAPTPEPLRGEPAPEPASPYSLRKPESSIPSPFDTPGAAAAEPDPAEPEAPLPPEPPAAPAYAPPVVESAPTPAFDPIADVPTLAQQTPLKEVHHTVSDGGGTSLNERLRQEQTELGKKLHGGPIKDLRKGIALNDRYLFISELFRGDEAMYERSIKTINAFHIYPEAEYWVNRELKLRLAWPESSEVVHYFDQLVRRRFS